LRICYLDESNPEPSAGRRTSSSAYRSGRDLEGQGHRDHDDQAPLRLERAEIHTGWLTRRCEQERIGDFEAMGTAERRAAVQKKR
jgi:hypothetical protein